MKKSTKLFQYPLKLPAKQQGCFKYMVKESAHLIILLSTVNVCTISVYSVTNHTAKGYCSRLRCLYLVLKYVIITLVSYSKLITNRRLFIKL